MNVLGEWELVSAHGFDAATFKQVWITNEELNLLPEDNFNKMMANATFDFKDNGKVTMISCTGKTVDDVPADELKEAVDAGQVIVVDNDIFMARDMDWKEEDGNVLIDSGERGEVLGEAINPWKPVEVLGNTIIINGTYQVVRKGETPSDVKKTVIEVKADDPALVPYAGTYTCLYNKFVGDPDTSKNTDDPFKLELEANGTGKSHRNDLDITVSTWSCENGEFKLTEKFLGTIDYTGKLEGNQLTLFNGEPTNPLTCMYVFEKA
ncbi:MAG: hypothetical protein J5522_05205 [Lachnospiraceae bacterium]|nr:hypothetical protein [Lachnospiraceae bacterium]